MTAAKTKPKSSPKTKSNVSGKTEEATAKKSKSPGKSTTKKTKDASGKKSKSVVSAEKKIKNLEAQINEWKSKAESMEGKVLRLRAEFENYRRRKEQEIRKILEFNGEDVFKEFLPIIDDMDRLMDSLESTGDDDPIKIGMTMIHKKLHARLEEWKVMPFGKPGDILDANLHDAMMVQSENGKKENEILQVYEKGYMYKDKVLRHAKVVVNKPQ